MVKWLALRAGQRQGGVFRLPPPYLWTPLSPQRVKGCSPLTNPRRKSTPKNASRFAKRIFCASPIYGSAEDFTFLLNFTPCKGVTPAAKQQIGETRKKRLAQRPAFFRFDFLFGIVKGEEPLTRCGESGVQRQRGGNRNTPPCLWPARSASHLTARENIPRATGAQSHLKKTKPYCNSTLPLASPARETAIYPFDRCYF